MKIAIPVDENNMETVVCPSFGRAPYFMIYDTDQSEATFILNTAANASGGAGIKAAQTVVDQKADVVLTVRCGQNSAEVINSANIKMYKTVSGTAVENIAFLEKGELLAITEFHPGFHGKQ
ncbi:MAG: dinitrogenase iron-molybdenum cofactor biosynthesis protein [Clostridia bacterium]|nr:dinitrogenase iron-molybdenum cofactor biosynthesis protein [Clostridia bacterium]